MPPKAAPSLADLVLEAPAQSSLAQAFGPEVWVKIGVVAALLVVLHFDQLDNLVRALQHNPNWMHGFLMPVFSLYLLYSRRHELLNTPRKTCFWGLPILLLSLLLQPLSVYPLRNDFFYQLNMIVMTLGIALFLGGTRIFRLTWLPIAFLAFSMPIPERLYQMMAYPLQELAARGSFLLLRLFGAQIENSASHLSVMSISGIDYPLEVAEACSGMRSLMAFVALGVAMAYLEERPVWQRVVLMLCAVPIAIGCNVLRVTITAIAYLVDKKEFGEKFMHEMTGILMLIPAFAMLWLVGKILEKIFVEEEEPSPSAEAAPAKAPPSLGDSQTGTGAST